MFKFLINVVDFLVCMDGYYGENCFLLCFYLFFEEEC